MIELEVHLAGEAHARDVGPVESGICSHSECEEEQGSGEEEDRGEIGPDGDLGCRNSERKEQS